MNDKVEWGDPGVLSPKEPKPICLVCGMCGLKKEAKKKYQDISVCEEHYKRLKEREQK
jgi:hypothetical protein